MALARRGGHFKHSKLAIEILDIIADEARFHLLFGKRVITIVHSNDSNINIPPVGVQPIVQLR